MKIADHIFYVTGGASGLGAATVRGLHAKGAHVAIWDLDVEGATRLSEELGGERTLVGEVDVTEEEDVRQAIQAADDKWKGSTVAGCVNCGGVGMAGKIIDAEGEPFNLDTFKKVVDINLVGTFNVSRLTAARIVRDLPRPLQKPNSETQDRGVIINTASAAAFEGQTGQVSYSASKGGVVGMSMPMARDLAWYGIRVMALAPALFSTPMMERLPQRAKDAILRTAEFPLRFGHPEEFAHAVIACIENSMLNGSFIRLDGATRLGKL
ncbi:NAD(P)-binding protein [Ceraceosorus guamensis]|uniref:NAD(P)-binding protein n=1 Tax=Ceraceosorus guamensis TaxID=1522189 RepID=A0A316W5D2_9BASI|nr:NAD(P)-binding protein [Ceraceosorus guamensis]PWN45039.1 NAD(P)-binding protein [Ceraceosorus guamensis]